jgi:hypothetical protein
MKANPMGMLWMIPTGWPDHPLKAAWPHRKVPPQGSLVARMNEFTLLDDAMGGSGGAAAGSVAGLARLADSDRSRGHMRLVANAATCLAQTKAPAKP